MRMTEEIGRVLNGRYRIIAPIGRGASAQVFLADDVTLRRRVAVKMLHSALAEDAAFLRRFQAEAQAAAALHNDHIMAVYDWGQDPDGNIPYMVLQYLGGGSLRAMLDAGNRLTLSQTLLLGMEAAKALEYAHMQGFVHRDIKPANLVFGDDGVLRVADFGLARALAEAGWTEPQGAVLGTARYASPEQAQGLALTGKSDVYALALVLIETVTGEVPFAADTTLGTLMARVGKPLEVPDAMGPMRSALERAGRADPEERLDAHRLGVALMEASEYLTKPDPFPLVGAVTPAGPGPEVDPTMLGFQESVAPPDLIVEPDDDLDIPDFMTARTAPGAAADPDGHDEWDVPDFLARPVPTDAPAPVIDLTTHDDHTTHDNRMPPDTRMNPGRPARTDEVVVEPAETVVEPDGAAKADERDGAPAKRRWPRRVFLAALLAAVALAASALVLELTRTPAHAVPTVVGVSTDVARARMGTFKWKIVESHTRKDGTDPNEVLAVSPKAGAKVKEGQTVRLTVSDGNTLATVPTNLVGMPVAKARSALKAASFKTTITEGFSEDVAPGLVIKPAPGTPVNQVKGDAVGLVVSKGPKPRAVPKLSGLSVDDAQKQLADLGLQSPTTKAYNDSVPEGQVIGTEPAVGAEVAKGSVVTVVVSLGKQPVKVPNVSGASTLVRAGEILRNAGLVPGGTVDGPFDGRPVGTNPPAGTEVPPGTTVNVVTRR